MFSLKGKGDREQLGVNIRHCSDSKRENVLWIKCSVESNKLESPSFTLIGFSTILLAFVYSLSYFITRPFQINDNNLFEKAKNDVPPQRSQAPKMSL